MSKKPAKKPARQKRAGRPRPPAATAAPARPRRSPALSRRVPPPPLAATELTIVGVGASAGGLEAFSQLLRSVPADCGIALVLVQHLAPHHDSALVALLAGQSAMPVIQAAEGVRVEANHVYVMPPNVHMAMHGDELHLTPRPEDASKYTPIDAFLSSLAATARERAVAVILSGTASDGAIGVRDVKNAGGITIAQAPETAKYDGMPQAAIATGMVDLVLAPSAIGVKLAQLSARGGAPSALPDDEADIQPGQLQRVFELLRPVSGVDFKHYKLPTIKRRLFRRMALHRLSDVSQYLQLLQGNPNEVRSLYQDLLIHVTRFFRDPDSFASLASHVFPSVIERRPADHPIRVWVSGCATGEEAYSLAITLVEFLQKDYAETRVQIFATDVSETAIEHARSGIYPTSIEADVSAERLRRFFTKVDGSYRVTKMIRDLCVFARQDLTKDPPFSHLDLILCRNVLIYMDAVLQKKLLSVFHYALNPGGFLVLGQAETVGAQATLFTLVDKKLRIHRKKDSVVQPSMTFPIDYTLAGVPRKKNVNDPAAAEKALQTEVSRIILDRYAPAGVVVDGDCQIVQFRGQTGAFLEPAPGEASLNLLKMAREGLLYGLRTALHAARKSRGPVRKDGLQVNSGHGWRPVSLEVLPLTSAGRLHYLVLFHAQEPGRHEPDARAPQRPRAQPGRAGRGARASQVDLLQRELAASREYLQSIIQELEAANEELQSANEEILSSNEELQSTNEELDTAKEELQSTNEELNTVNEELHGRNEELSRVNSDLVNLVGSVQIAIVIVSADLRIRRFTPMAEKVLNLIPSDLDRSIGHINPNIDCPNLEQLIADCIDTVSPLEREVQDRQGRWYSLRIRPYKNVDNKIDGAVLALFDADAPKRFEDRLRAAIEIVRGVVAASSAPLAIVDGELRVTMANGAFAAMLGRDVPEVDGQPLDAVVPGSGSALDELRHLLAGTPPASGRVHLARNGLGEPMAVNVQVLGAFDGAPARVLLLAPEWRPQHAH
jgi:two-component system, chemotaxis family, CheB/CheR fusion protein